MHYTVDLLPDKHRPCRAIPGATTLLHNKTTGLITAFLHALYIPASHCITLSRQVSRSAGVQGTASCTTAAARRVSMCRMRLKHAAQSTGPL